jgi:hypothetical protein
VQVLFVTFEPSHVPVHALFPVQSPLTGRPTVVPGTGVAQVQVAPGPEHLPTQIPEQDALLIAAPLQVPVHCLLQVPLQAGKGG